VMVAVVVDVAVVDAAVGVVVPVSASPNGICVSSDAARVAIEMPRRKRRIRRMHIIAVGDSEYHTTGRLATKEIRTSAKEALN